MTSPSGEQFTFSDVDRSGRAAALEAQLQVQAKQFEADRRRRLGLLGLAAGGSALDVGCGLGELTLMLAEIVGPSGTVVGIDPSEAMVTRARETTAAEGQIDIRRGDGTALDFADETFDAVHSERVFMHLDEPDRAVAEALRVTRPGGRIMVVDPDHSMTRVDTDDSETAAAIFWTMAATKMKNPRSGTRLVGQFRRAGLEDIDVDGTIALVREPPSDARSFVQSLTDAADVAVHAGTAIQQAADEFLREVTARLEARTFLMLMPMIAVVGTKPNG